ncbi:MAG: CinA family protein [Rhodomicrobium sp.]
MTAKEKSALTRLAEEVLQEARAAGLKIATAESCTGGLVAAALTSIAGSSDVFDRGFVTYSNEAKEEMLGVSAILLQDRGAVSREVAIAMAEGALSHSPAQLSVAVTGIAGPGGGSAEKPVGLVHFAAARKMSIKTPEAGIATIHEEKRFAEIGREAVRTQSVDLALRLLLRATSLK